MKININANRKVAMQTESSSKAGSSASTPHQIFGGYGRRLIVLLVSVLCLVLAPNSQAAIAMLWPQLSAFVEQLTTATQSVTTAMATAQTQINTAQQLINQAKNLENAPANLIAQTIAPYQQALSAYQKFQTDAQALQSSVTSTESMLSQRSAEAQTLASNPAQYWQMEAALAQQQGGTYKAALVRDQQTLQDLASKATALQNSANNLPSGGNVQALDKLNTTLTALVESTLNLNRQFAQANADQNAKADLAASNEQAIDAANTSLGQQLLMQSNNDVNAVNAALQSQPTGIYHLRTIEQQAWQSVPSQPQPPAAP